MRLFLSQGYGRTTVEQITAEAGVAKGTFFNYFRSKDEVLGQLGRMQVERLRGALAEVEGFAARHLRDQLRFIYHVLGAGIEGQRELVLLVTAVSFARRDSEAVLTGLDEFDEILLPLVEAAQARGELRADSSPRLQAALLRNIYFMAVFEWLRQDGGPFGAVADRQLDLALDGLRPRSNSSQEG